MADTTTRILNIDILTCSREEALANISKGVLFTPNVDHLCKLQKDREFYECYLAADWIVCDSQVLYRLSSLLDRPIPEAIPGSSFFTSFYEFHKNDPNCKIFLLGAAPGVAKSACQLINAKVGRDIIVGAHSPSYGFEKNLKEISDIVKIVNDSGANVVLVGVGAPKQEKFIIKYKDQMPGVDLWMALGATIDFEAGNIKRAPKWMQKVGMEWFYRLMKEPNRMFKRYIVDDMKFFWYFLKQLCGIYTNPFEKNQ